MKSRSKVIMLIVASVILVVWSVLTIIPMYWMLIGSVQDTKSAASFIPKMIPEVFSVAPYERFLAKPTS